LLATNTFLNKIFIIIIREAAKLKKKLIGIFVLTLLIGTNLIPIVNSEFENNQNDNNESVKLLDISEDCGCTINDEFNEIYSRFPVRH
jgi:hypothetical protein